MLPLVHIIYRRVSDALRLITVQLHLFPLIFFISPTPLFACPTISPSVSVPIYLVRLLLFSISLSLTVCQTVLSIIR